VTDRQKDNKIRPKPAHCMETGMQCPLELYQAGPIIYVQRDIYSRGVNVINIYGSVTDRQKDKNITPKAAHCMETDMQCMLDLYQAGPIIYGCRKIDSSGVNVLNISGVMTDGQKNSKMTPKSAHSIHKASIRVCL
jgi:hypothetical protein